MEARLKRMASPSLFGADVQELAFHAEMQSNNCLHFKVHTDMNHLSLSHTHTFLTAAEELVR